MLVHKEERRLWTRSLKKMKIERGEEQWRGTHPRLLAGDSQAFCPGRGAPGRRLTWSLSRAEQALPLSHGFAVPVHFACLSAAFQAEDLVETSLGIIAKAFSFWQKQIQFFFSSLKKIILSAYLKDFQQI